MKGGGHNSLIVDSTAGAVEHGSGLTWNQVYTALDPTGVNIVGARVPGISIARVTPGGGECLSPYVSPGCGFMILSGVFV